MKKIIGFCSLSLFSIIAYSADLAPQPAPGCVPRFENGQPQGCSVVEPGMKGGKKSGAVYEKLGLKNGDVIHGVDGNKVSDPQAAMKEMQLGGKTKSAKDLNVLRGGKPMKVEVKPQTPPAGE